MSRRDVMDVVGAIGLVSLLLYVVLSRVWGSC